jgi:hypothetical protein
MTKKGVAIIDLPENCDDCPFNYDMQECVAHKDFMRIEYECGADRHRPEWCPLVEMNETEGIGG